MGEPPRRSGLFGSFAAVFLFGVRKRSFSEDSFVGAQQSARRSAQRVHGHSQRWFWRSVPPRNRTSPHHLAILWEMGHAPGAPTPERPAKIAGFLEVDRPCSMFSHGAAQARSWYVASTRELRLPTGSCPISARQFSGGGPPNGISFVNHS